MIPSPLVTSRAALTPISPCHEQMAKVVAAAPSCAAAIGSAFVPKPSPLLCRPAFAAARNQKPVRIHAKLGGGDGETKPAQKKFITREEEPEQYWQTAGEREGENPMKTPLPYIIIFGMSTPFVILAIAFANGWIKMPIR